MSTEVGKWWPYESNENTVGLEGWKFLGSRNLRFIESERNWWYLSCKRCPKKNNDDEGENMFKEGKKVPHLQFRSKMVHDRSLRLMNNPYALSPSKSATSVNDQHDSKEFLALLLDALYEYKNHVKHKPCAEVNDEDGR
ncbi:hypothetical protein Fot_34537 [Forsythia ovata]|uniref:Uncharacterized protein n=1 Tax=Forsythia ovata TaxID=205694 RepID=A0ABD1SIY8_9LAMI